MWRIRSKLAGSQLCRVFDNQERTGQLLKSLLDLFSMKSVGRSGIFFLLSVDMIVSFGLLLLIMKTA